MKSYVAPLYLLVFLPAVVFLYNIVPKKLRPVVLLLASYLFFWSISGKLILFLLISTFSIHHFGLWLSSLQEERNRILAETERPERKAVKAEYIRRQRWVIFLAVCIHTYRNAACAEVHGLFRSEFEFVAGIGRG